jgi:hypothetical protein
MQLVGVLVEQAAGAVASAHTALLLADDGWIGGRIRWLEPERPVWPVGVVVLDVDSEDLLEVAAPEDQQPVQTLGADGADPPLGVGVGVGCLHRFQEYLGALRPEHVVEAAGEFHVAIVEEEAHPLPSISEHQQEVAGLLGDPAAVRSGGAGRSMRPRRAVGASAAASPA